MVATNTLLRLNAQAVPRYGWPFARHTGPRNRIKAELQKGSPIVDEALLRIAALYKIEDADVRTASGCS
jgi:hypothetical protein